MEKIKILKDGPYEVSGAIPLDELIIENTDKGNILKKAKDIETGEIYHLCRCGKTKTPPFCDGSHVCEHFDGTTTASKKTVIENSVYYKGEDIILADSEELCAYARFCHNNETDVWNATEKNDIKNAKKLSTSCPSGRLSLFYMNQETPIESDFKPSISILQDPAQKCSGPLWVKGNIQIEDSDGYEYEKRNRVTLCRCGASNNKPFCDAHHVEIKYKDKK